MKLHILRSNLLRGPRQGPGASSWLEEARRRCVAFSKGISDLNKIVANFRNKQSSDGSGTPGVGALLPDRILS